MRTLRNSNVLSGVAHITELGRDAVARLQVASGPSPVSIGAVAESDRALENLGRTMERAVAKGTSKDGRIDWRTAAAHMMAVMMENQR